MINVCNKDGFKTNLILLALWTPQVFVRGDAAVTVADEGELICLDGSILLSGSFCFGKDDDDDDNGNG